MPENNKIELAEYNDSILDIIDLDRYPIDDLTGNAGREFLLSCQQHMAAHGWCNLDGFIREQALDYLVDEVNTLLPGAGELNIRRNIYGQNADPALADNDPARLEFNHTALQLADDQIPGNTLIKQLYKNQSLIDFVARVQQKQTLYCYGDEFQALNIVAINPGQWHGWHYDYNECTVTLLLQAAQSGGEFTFLPNIRDNEPENHQTIMAFLNGDTGRAKTFPRAAGAFTMFRGEYSLHGVTPVKGSIPRITAVLTYDEQPGRTASDEINIKIYGSRVDKILSERKAIQ